MSDEPHETPLWHINETTRKLKEGLAQSSFAEPTLLGGKPLIPNEQFVIAQANQTLSTLVAYESQYKNDVPKDIQRRILELSDFIHQQLKAMGAETKSAA